MIAAGIIGGLLAAIFGLIDRLALSMLFDGIHILVLPLQLNELADQRTQAILLGLLTGALMQASCRALSDRLRPLLGWKGFIGIGLLFSLAS
jgi:hypothetical protein